jgi:hypothetical protein
MTPAMIRIMYACDYLARGAPFENNIDTFEEKRQALIRLRTFHLVEWRDPVGWRLTDAGRQRLATTNHE